LSRCRRADGDRAPIRGDSPGQAQHHTQEFLTRFLEGNYFDRVDPERGRFRSFQLSSFKSYLASKDQKGNFVR
jgi:hypothetical protein